MRASSIVSLHHAGPSPRVRGKRTHPVSVESRMRTVHPRACGGNRLRPADLPVGDEGSIPARAGETAQTEERAILKSCRSIPARAGETSSQRQSALARVVLRSIPARAGETTRVRKRHHPQETSSSIRRVHPRACGGNHRSNVSAAVISHRGPSPRVRGKPHGRGCTTADRHRRSIPARAGETSTSTLSRSQIPLQAVHPRACGGNIVMSDRCANVGS